ncbi:hypothetical protein F0170_07445 [Pseudomonas sp. MAFF 730085]|uniref:Uncharacterized protein n=1 Tax=Pseudomonas kitaguniensis TaxID=2607908 RepID=A0A5N7JRH3_9PSED|nr:hypothetical protein [Pseudomonas kitaguniensis]MPQ83833.1 hypothetical protein [Pseudomonas kitaguniensis]
MKKIMLLLSLISASAVASQAENVQAQYLVPGSTDHDFGVLCVDQGRETFSINSDKNNAYRHARNIVFTNLGGGRVLMSLLHGFSNADTPSTHLTSATEQCDTFKQ